MMRGNSNALTEQLPEQLLIWYRARRRHLPWRAAPGKRNDPYKVWLSEIMLQQTTVVTVIPYFENFLARWPTVTALAAAELDQVLHAWQGLGYYARARNMHKCARQVTADFAGKFPDNEAELGRLPGIGPYTAAAVAAIAFGRRATPMDGNFDRVMARLFAVEIPLPAAKPTLREHAVALTPEKHAGDFAQAVMDLGATVCLPKKPACEACPWSEACQARARGMARDLPRRAARKARPTRHGAAFWLTREIAGDQIDRAGQKDGTRENHEVLLRRRPEKGLLGGMMEVPGTPWRERGWPEEEALSHAPSNTEWRRLTDTVVHVFTHFRLELAVYCGELRDDLPNDGLWQPIDRLSEQALPTLMKKVIHIALGEKTKP